MSQRGLLPDFGGRYRATRVISDRERSTTLAAVDPQSGDQRFVKLASESARDDPAAQAAFRQEPAILRKLGREAGPGVVLPVVDEGFWEGRPYFAQPLLEGWSLAHALRRRPAFDAGSTLHVIRQNLRQLQAVHAVGVVHGDVSPENIFVVSDEPAADEEGGVPPGCGVQLVDFEMARRIDGPENRPGGPVVGKAPYMAPELVRGEPLSPRSDLYALGAVFYEMLTGGPPFEAETLRDVARRIDAAVPPIPLDLEVPALVEDVVRRMLAPDPGQRTETASEALRALHRLDDVHRWLTRGPSSKPVRPARPHRATPGVPYVIARPEAKSLDRITMLTLGVPPRASRSDAESPAPGPVREVAEREEFPTGMGPPATTSPAPEPPGERIEFGTVIYSRPDQPGSPPDSSPTGPDRSGPPPDLPPAGRDPAGPGDEPAPPGGRFDEDVQFTVYRPQTIRPEVWYPLLAFAHLAERPPDAPEDEPDPLEEVRRQARQALGPRFDRYKDLTQDSRRSIPREGELSFVPSVPGIRFNPPRRTFRWEESVHREEFRLRASAELHGQVARGSISVFWESILVADIVLTIRVDRDHLEPASDGEPPARDVARPYRKIFVSYSHKDLPIVQQIETFVKMMGDNYLRDWTHLRSGEVWTEKLRRLIHEADVFQLCWSSHSMHSRFVRQEWEYALSLGRDNFVRPSYWEHPFPRSDEPLLPPEGLKDLHFQRIELAAGAASAHREAGPKSEPGMTLGSYLVEELLGRGGTGTVARGRHRTTGAPVIIKQVSEPEVGRALLGEVPAFTRIRHPQVVRVVDAFEHAGGLVLVRDFAEGRDLAAWRGNRPITPAEAAEVVASLAMALHHAHELGYVHRDLGPRNVLVDSRGAPLLWADHLVAYPAGTFLGWLDDRGMTHGTLSCMAPERIDGAIMRHDRRADVYALGVILFELLTGRNPFIQEGAGRAEIVRKIVGDEPPAPQSLDPGVPDALNAICLGCLRKDASGRYPTAAALAEDLQRRGAGATTGEQAP